MKLILKVFACLIFFNLSSAIARNLGPNQTDALSPVLPQSGLPFSIRIEKINFELPVGFHSGVVGVYRNYWIFIAGRINGLHGFGPTNDFPPDQQNTTIYVINYFTGAVASRALTDASAGLTQRQIDTLSVTSPQGFQQGDTLFMTGGYGYNNETSTYDTKPVLTAIYLPGIVDWVLHAGSSQSVAKNIKQLYRPLFQVTGGRMFRVGNTMKLVFGQNFTGEYTPASNGNYTEQVRIFRIHNNGDQLSVTDLNLIPTLPDPNFRRRDLNVVPTLLNVGNQLSYGLIAYSGVFTQAGGVWTVPVVIDSKGNPTMADPNLPSTFKQAMNQYVSATASLYSKQTANMYHIFLGGLSYGYFDGGTFQTDAEVPFINQVTTVKRDQFGHFTQYIMNNEYPVIPSTGTNPGNPLLFGAGAYFIPANITQYPNRVISLDSIRKPTVIGYILGGIMSTLPNTNTQADSAASPYVFKVTLVPNS